MGTGIAQVLAVAGIDVTLVDPDASALERAEKTLATRLRARKDEAGDVKTASEPGDAAGAEVVIEAVYESIDAKRQVFYSLDRLFPPETLLATNTSSLAVGEIAGATERPERVVGMHFMNPAPVMKLVEVVRSEASSDQAVDRAAALARQIGKTPVVVRDRPCFVVNRLLMPVINEAARALDEGVAEAEAIDAAMKLGANWPMGPLHLADLIGLDVVLEELRTLEAALGPGYGPSPAIERLVNEGSLGRRTGSGFFGYGPGAGKEGTGLPDRSRRGAGPNDPSSASSPWRAR
jgi:3-hydroxybutyryl-CoA dehydrogenase